MGRTGSHGEPVVIDHHSHRHALYRVDSSPRGAVCDDCNCSCVGVGYYCQTCDFLLHKACALASPQGSTAASSTARGVGPNGSMERAVQGTQIAGNLAQAGSGVLGMGHHGYKLYTDVKEHRDGGDEGGVFGGVLSFFNN